MKRSLALASILGLLCGSPTSAALTRIGAAGGVGGKVLAFAPEAGAAGRIMSSGKPVYSMDKVTSDSSGRMQVLLLDETVFTIGPNSEFILDEFVYDPATETGKVTAQVTKGVFRFVSGKVARKRPSDVNIKLPSGTIGIRGTILGGKVEGNTAIVALLGPGGQNDANERPGSIAVQNAGVTVDITRTGYATRIDGPGIPPTPPFQLTPAQVDQLNAAPAAQAPKEKEEKSGTAPAKPGEPAEKTEAGPAKEKGESKGGLFKFLKPRKEKADKEKSASEESGETTSSAQGDLTTTQSTGGLAQDFTNTTVVASQSSGIADGPSTWDQVRSSVITGSGYYHTSGVANTLNYYSPGTSSYDFYVDVNFGTKQITAASAQLTSVSNGLTTGWASWSGAAAFGTSGTASHAFTSGWSNAYFSGSNVTFMNAAGVAGQQMEMSLHYNDGSGNSIASGANAIGTFTP